MTMKFTLAFSFFALFVASSASAAISVSIDAKQGNRPISPYIYGKNGATSDQTTSSTSDAEMTRIREAGIRLARQNNGNNCTKYNWRKKLTCHPDWYNNIYDCDWDLSAQSLADDLPGVQALYGFQLIGKVAKIKAYNFDDWSYNQSQWGTWCSLDLCGGGSADASGNLIKAGDTSLYLQDWPADSVVAIYTHWRDDLHLDMSQFKYWNMDNEMEMWPWTHSDVVAANNDTVFEAMMQNYFATAKAIKAIEPSVKLCAPAAGSEWTWYFPANVQPTYQGVKYCWLEYFIMRCALEQKASGVKMLDVLDLHFYPGEEAVDDVLQSYRVLWDTSFVYSQANGVKTVNTGWDNTQNKEYIFQRCQNWIDKYFGENSGITFAISEYDNQKSFTPTVTALSYASFLGDAARHGLEYFTPWVWNIGMWETLHLFSRYAQSVNVEAVSSNEEMLSAYTSINTAADSMTVILINRNQTEAQTVNLSISNFAMNDGVAPTYQLANLGSTETFNSHTDNALSTGTTQVSANTFSLTVPALSLTAVVLKKSSAGVEDALASSGVALYPNPASVSFCIEANATASQAQIIDASGRWVKTVTLSNGKAVVPVSDLASGIYSVRILSANSSSVSQLVVK